MSYDMWFWKQSSDCCLTPEDIIEKLCEGDQLEGLFELNFNKIKDRIKLEFAEFDGQMFDAETHYFTLDIYTPFAFQIISTPPNNDAVIDMLNRIIDIAHEFECLLYDPQSGERYS